MSIDRHKELWHDRELISINIYTCTGNIKAFITIFKNT